MGQKVHPLGFRLGVTEDHKSKWFTKFNNYANTLKLDDILRMEFKKILRTIGDKQKEEIADRSNILINHNLATDKIIVEIKTTNPNLLIEKLTKNKQLLNLSSKIKKELGNKQILLRLTKLADPNLQAGLLAQELARSLEKRTAFRRAIRNTIDTFNAAVKTADLDPTQVGIKIQVSGRVNGAEIARTEWIRNGRVPLHTIQAKISYAYERSETIYGTLGVKIWICTG